MLCLTLKKYKEGNMYNRSCCWQKFIADRLETSYTKTYTKEHRGKLSSYHFIRVVPNQNPLIVLLSQRPTCTQFFLLTIQQFLITPPFYVTYFATFDVLQLIKSIKLCLGFLVIVVKYNKKVFYIFSKRLSIGYE